MLAAEVDVTVIRISNETVASALQLPVEFVEYEIAEQWRKWTPLWSPFHTWANQPVLHHPGIQVCPDEFGAKLEIFLLKGTAKVQVLLHPRP
jgi:hypothetical protein